MLAIIWLMEKSFINIELDKDCLFVHSTVERSEQASSYNLSFVAYLQNGSQVSVLCSLLINHHSRLILHLLLLDK